jgi:hypothetical protein
MTRDRFARVKASELTAANTQDFVCVHLQCIARMR